MKGSDELDSYNFEKVAELIEAAKGSDRSMRQYAAEAGLNPATLNLIFKGTRKANYNHIMKLTSMAAAPRNRVTYLDLCKAAGLNALIVTEDGEETTTADVDWHDYQSELEILATGVINKAYRDNNISAKEIAVTDDYIRPYISFETADRVEEWYVVASFRGIAEKELSATAQQLLGKMVFAEPKEKRKIIIVVDTEDAYKKIASFAGKLSFKGNLEVRYLNCGKLFFHKEKMLSRFE